MRLPLPLAGCTRVGISAVVAMPARAAVAVVIRSLSTLLGVTHHRHRSIYLGWALAAAGQSCEVTMFTPTRKRRDRQ